MFILFNVAYKAKNSSPELTQHAVAGLGDFTVPEDDKKIKKNFLVFLLKQKSHKVETPFNHSCHHKEAELSEHDAKNKILTVYVPIYRAFEKCKLFSS